MEYYPPYGSIDPDAPYVDRSTPNAIQGSKIPAKAVEHPQREIIAVIEAAGLVPAVGSTTQLLEALQQFFGQFPIWPDCLNSNGTFDLTTPSPGTIRVPAGISWVMRGATRYTSVQTDRTTISNKTYHMRWDKVNGFRLRDLSDVAYNPTAALETNAAFDTTYDDVLVARVVTDGINVATITNLKNKPKLVVQTKRHDVLSHQLNWVTLAGSGTTLNWARTPDVEHVALSEWGSNNVDPDGVIWAPAQGHCVGVGLRIPTGTSTRYAISALDYWYEDDVSNQGVASATLLAMAI